MAVRPWLLCPQWETERSRRSADWEDGSDRIRAEPGCKAARRLGFADLKELKRDLRRQSRADLDNAASRFRIGGPNQERLARSLEMEQAALAAAYGLAHGKLWDRIV